MTAVVDAGRNGSRRRGALRAEGLLGSLLVATALLLPFNVERIYADYGRYSDVQHRISVYWVDVPLAVLALVSLVSLPWATVARKLHSVVGIFAELLALTLLSLAFTPSSRGVQLVLRLVAAVVIPVIVIPFLNDRWTRRLVVALLAGVAFQAGIAVLQVATGRLVGLGDLGELGTLYEKGGWASAKGTFAAPHLLAAFSAVAAGLAVLRYVRRPSLGTGLTVAVCSVPLALAFVRMGVLAALVIVGAMALSARRSRRGLAVAAVAIVVGLGIPALLTRNAWWQRLQETADLSGVQGVASRRGEFTRDAFSMIGQDPLVGVGPGLYVLVLEERLDTPPGTETLPVHNVPLLVAAELGIPVGLLVTAALALLGWHAWRRDPWLLVVYLAYLPFLMLDHLAYDTVPGLALTGLWAGLLVREVIRPLESEEREGHGYQTRPSSLSAARPPLAR